MARRKRRGRVGRATAQAGGYGDALVDLRRSGGASQPVAARNSSSARAARFSPATAMAHNFVALGAGRARLQHELVGERDRLHHACQLVAAVGAGGPDEQTQVDLGGGQRAQWQGKR